MGVTLEKDSSLQVRNRLKMGYQEIKLEWPEVPKLKLKVLFLSHLVLISWASLGDWSGESILLHNIFFLLTFVCFAIDTLSIILDIIILASRYPSRQSSVSSMH